MSRSAYVVAVVKQAKNGPYSKIAGLLYAILGAVSLFKSEFIKSTSAWANSRTIDWTPSMSLQAWTILGLLLALGIVFEAAYRLHRRQSEELEAFQSKDDEQPELGTLDEELDDLADKLRAFLDGDPDAYRGESFHVKMLVDAYYYKFGPTVRWIKKWVAESNPSEETLARFDQKITNESDIEKLAEFLTNLAATVRTDSSRHE